MILFYDLSGKKKGIVHWRDIQISVNYNYLNIQSVCLKYLTNWTEAGDQTVFLLSH